MLISLSHYQVFFTLFSYPVSNLHSAAAVERGSILVNIEPMVNIVCGYTVNTDPTSVMGHPRYSGRSFPALFLHSITAEPPWAAEDRGLFLSSFSSI